MRFPRGLLFNLLNLRSLPIVQTRPSTALYIRRTSIRLVKNSTNTTKKATIGITAVLLMVAVAYITPVMAAATTSTDQPQTTTTTTTSSVPTLAVGQAITFTSIEGGYKTQGGSTAQTGDASGSFTLTVTGTFDKGYSLSVSSGSLTVAGQTYQIGSGSAELGPHLAHLVGQATLTSASATDAGSLLFRARNIGKFGSVRNAIVGMDVQAGGNEYLVRLLVTVS